jgi:hypothetical protein
MASTTRRYSKEEFARHGDAIYELDARPLVRHLPIIYRDGRR